jgi:hypothetical protein
MAGFRNHRELIEADKLGQTTMFSFRKTPVVTTVAGIWFDLSMSPGNPIPNYYANTPLQSAQLIGTEGLFHGGPVLPSYKYIREIMMLSGSATGLPLRVMLLDYLLYYPFVDQGSTDEQFMVNSLPLPRYADGNNVQIMPVLVGAQTGGQTFSVKYTNQDGVTGRVTPTVICNTANYNGAVVCSQPNAAQSSGPFMPLQGTDTGVRAIESVTMNGADVGLMTLVLVRPLESFSLNEATAPVEVSYATDLPGLTRVVDGAYLNMICLPNGSLSGVPLHGLLTTVWN